LFASISFLFWLFFFRENMISIKLFISTMLLISRKKKKKKKKKKKMLDCFHTERKDEKMKRRERKKMKT